MVRHNGILALYGDSYAPINEFCFHRFHEDGLEVRNLNGVHYTRLRSVENMREAYRAVQRGVFNLDIIFQNVDGTLAAWYMNGLNVAAMVVLNPPSPSDVQWHVVGTIDLNRDGKTDLLFQHSGDGSVAVWYMNGINLTQALLLNPSNPGDTWKIVAPK